MSRNFLNTFMATILATGLSTCHATTVEAFEEEPKVATAPGAPRAIAGCTFQVDRPHKSIHVPGTINVVARIRCNRPVGSLEMTLGLARNGVELKKSTFANSGVASLQGHVDVPCVSGTYNGGAVATITSPFHPVPPPNRKWQCGQR